MKKTIKQHPVKMICLIIFIIATLITAYFLPPQTSRYIYIVQCFVFDKGIDSGYTEIGDWILPPKDYTGEWPIYAKTGKKYFLYNYFNGMKHGLQYSYWSKTGRIAVVTLYQNGEYINDIKSYTHDGTIFRSFNYDLKSFLPHGKWIRKAHDGEKVSNYINGVLQEEKPYIHDVPPPNFSGIRYYYGTRTSENPSGKELYRNGKFKMIVSSYQNLPGSNLCIYTGKNDKYEYSRDLIELPTKSESPWRATEIESIIIDNGNNKSELYSIRFDDNRFILSIVDPDSRPDDPPVTQKDIIAYFKIKNMILNSITDEEYSLMGINKEDLKEVDALVKE